MVGTFIEWSFLTQTGWWFQPSWNILVKMGIFPKFRGEKEKKNATQQTSFSETWVYLPLVWVPQTGYFPMRNISKQIQTVWYMFL